MAYTYRPRTRIEEWPDGIVPQSQTLQLLTNTKRLESPFGRYMQTQETSGALWRLQAQFLLDEVQAAELRAFAARLRGTAGYFYYKAEPSVYPVYRQAVDEDGLSFYRDFDRPFISQVVDSTHVLTSGWMTRLGGPAPTGTLVLARGEYLSYDDVRGYRHLHVATKDAVVGDDGHAEVCVEPPIYTPPPIGTSLMWECPSAAFHLSDDGQLAINELPGGEFHASVSAVQALCPDISFGAPSFVSSYGGV